MNFLKEKEIDSFKDAIYLYPTNSLIQKYNYEFMQNNKLPVIRILSVNNPNIEISLTDEVYRLF